MTKPETTCDPTRVHRLLEGQLSATEQQDVESHLEVCPRCLKLIKDSSVDEDWWNKPSEFLATDEFDKDVDASEKLSGADITRIDSYSESIQHDGLRRVVELLSPTDDPHMLGRLGRYEIVGAIGFGGMAVVLKGFETALNRFVAIKVLAPHLASSDSARSRFSREARAAASVLHPNVIAIHSVAEFRGLPYLVMPYIAGGSLQDRIDAEGPLSVEATVRIGMQIAAGLAAAHVQGLVHRDIKPANILLQPGLERVVITDFGLARAADDASITQTGMLAGTPHYMSPEQAKGDKVDCCSDLFSLGSLLFTVAVGKVPFRAETSYGVLRHITDQDAPSVRDEDDSLPAWLDVLIKRLHANSPNDRYQSAEQVSHLLEQCLASLQQPGQPIPASLLPAPRRNVPKWAVGAMMLLCMGITYQHWSRNTERNFKLIDTASESKPSTPVTWPEDGEWATLTGRFMLEDDVPVADPIQPTRDSDLYRDPIVDETLVVNPENGGIANMFVWIELSIDAKTHASYHNSAQSLTLQYREGRIHPHALTLRSSQTFQLRNGDPIPHNVRVGRLLQTVIEPGKHLSSNLAATESPASVSCEFHPWCRSYVLVQDHPYMAVTDGDGVFRIEKIPSGKCSLRVWHETTGYIEYVVNDRGFVEHWDGGRREIEMSQPLIDLGELVPELDSFIDGE